MKPGDLVNNTHALDRSGLGLIVEIREHMPPYHGCDYRVQWISPPPGCPEYSWNSAAWLEIVNEGR
jgi:hypothetical protein